jgi:hypothetical protein
MVFHMSDASDELDGCEIDFTDPEHLTEDGEQQDALVMFADIWDDPEAVERRKIELEAWAIATARTDDA